MVKLDARSLRSNDGEQFVFREFGCCISKNNDAAKFSAAGSSTCAYFQAGGRVMMTKSSMRKPSSASSERTLRRRASFWIGREARLQSCPRISESRQRQKSHAR